jgi:hypothetical protein
VRGHGENGLSTLGRTRAIDVRRPTAADGGFDDITFGR